MKTLHLLRAGFRALSRAKNEIETFDAAEIPAVTEDINKLLKQMPSPSTFKEALTALRDMYTRYPSVSESQRKMIDEQAKSDIKSLSESMEVAHQALSQTQMLLTRLAEIETKIGNDIRIEHNSREKLHSQKLRHTILEKGVDVIYSVFLRVASTASVILVVMLLLWYAKSVEAPIPALLAPVPADKHFKAADPTSSVKAPHTQIDLFLNKLWKPTTIMRAPDQGAH
ncbi:hypothetical protein ACEK07_04465 [Alcanivoracaceae bacterium MT1]